MVGSAALASALTVLLIGWLPDVATAHGLGVTTKTPNWVLEAGYSQGYPTTEFILPNHDLIVVGRADSTSTYGTVYTLIRRITRAGNVVWSVRVNGLAPSSAALSADQRLLVGGILGKTCCPDQGSGRAMMFDQNGGLQWSRTITGPLGFADVDHVVLDANGNSTVYGLKLVGAVSYQPYLEQFDAAGTPRWSRALPYNPGGGAPTLGGAAVDAAGNIYLTARLYAAAAPSDRSVLLKYNANGDSLGAVTDTLAGNLRVTPDRVIISRVDGSKGGIAGLDLGLTPRWRINARPSRLVDAGAGVLLAVTGSLGNQAIDMRSTTTGALLFGSSPLLSEIQNATYLEDVGVFVTGYNSCCGNRAEFCTKLSLGGEPLWTQGPYQSADGNSNLGVLVRADRITSDSTFVYVLGKAHSPHAGITLAQVLDDLGPTVNVPQLQARFLQMSVSPNPLHNDAEIRFEGARGSLRVELYDLRGRRIFGRDLSEGTTRVVLGRKELEKAGSGVHFLRAIDAGGVVVKRVVVY